MTYNILTVKAGGAGSIEVDPNKFTQAVLEYVLGRGLQEQLKDAHAAVTPTTNPDDLEEAKLAAAMKKLDRLYAGEVGRESGERGDPVERELAQMAWRHAAGVIKKAAKANKAIVLLKDRPKEQREAILAKTLLKYEAEWRPVAERVVAARKEAVADQAPDADELAELGIE